MSKHIMENGDVITVTHIMADGSVRDSVAGYEVPFNETTYPFYRVLANTLERMMKEESQG